MPLAVGSTDAPDRTIMATNAELARRRSRSGLVLALVLVGGAFASGCEAGYYGAGVATAYDLGVYPYGYAYPFPYRYPSGYAYRAYPYVRQPFGPREHWERPGGVYYGRAGGPWERLAPPPDRPLERSAPPPTTPGQTHRR
jgi:hypothetical protein